MRLFEVEGNTLSVTPQAIAIKEFKKIYSRDKRNKERAKKELMYVYSMCDYKSVYNDVPDDQKETMIINDIFGEEDWKPDIRVKEAMDKYVSLNETAESKSIKSIKSSILTSADLIERLKESIKFKMDNPDKLKQAAEEYKEIQSIAKEFPTVVDTLDKLEKRVAQKSEEESQIGNRQSNPFEDGI